MDGRAPFGCVYMPFNEGIYVRPDSIIVPRTEVIVHQIKLWEEVTLSDINTTFITIEQMEAATDALLENGKKVGADSWQQRVKNQTPALQIRRGGHLLPHLLHGSLPHHAESAARHLRLRRGRHRWPQLLRFTAGGAATHSDHGRSIAHTLYLAKEGGNYQVKDPEKLIRIAKELGHRDREPRYLRHRARGRRNRLLEYGKPFGVQRFLKRAPEARQEVWHREGIEPRAIDREVSQSMHMTHMGCSPA